jgi:hypothetical protein
LFAGVVVNFRKSLISRFQIYDQPISYADAGVSIDNANLALEKIKNYAKSTFNEKTLTEIGSFGGMFSAMFPEMSDPVLVASADGVGTKVKNCFRNGNSPHNRTGFGQSLRQRHSRAGRETAFFSSIILRPETLARSDGFGRRRNFQSPAKENCCVCSAAKRRKCPASTKTVNTI